MHLSILILPQTGGVQPSQGIIDIKKVFFSTIQCSKSSQWIFIDKNIRKMSLALIGLHFDLIFVCSVRESDI